MKVNYIIFFNLTIATFYGELMAFNEQYYILTMANQHLLHFDILHILFLFNQIFYILLIKIKFE